MKLEIPNPSPIILFVYNRLWHTQQTITSLAKNELASKSKLIIFSDGPKNHHDSKTIQLVREYLRGVTGFQSVQIHESNSNKGLANSVISGISKVLKVHQSAIVLEDDMVTSPVFLSYMNGALKMYENDEEVISIHGYVYPVKEKLPETFFLKGADCWGWATWQRGWTLFEPDGKKLLDELQRKELSDEFDFYGAYPFTNMLKRQIKGQNQSWAIRWYASAFLKEKMTLYPGTSLVKNIGNDTSGTHSWDNDRFDHSMLATHIDLKKIKAEENIEVKRVIGSYLKSSTPSILKKLFYKIKFRLNLR